MIDGAWRLLVDYWRIWNSRMRTVSIMSLQ